MQNNHIESWFAVQLFKPCNKKQQFIALTKDYNIYVYYNIYILF